MTAASEGNGDTGAEEYTACTALGLAALETIAPLWAGIDADARVAVSLLPALDADARVFGSLLP